MAFYAPHRRLEIYRHGEIFKKPTNRKNTMTFVSVIIPCRNEAKYIAACLDSILACGQPHEAMEIIVADGCSDDDTPAIVRRYAAKYPFIRLLRNEGYTVPFALNLALRHASAPIIVRMDAHATMAENYIQHGLNVLAAQTEVGNVGGIFVNNFENEQAKCIANAMGHPFGVGNASFRLANKDGYVDTVPYGIFRREVFEKVGLYDLQLTRNQDDELNFRIEKGGFKIYLDRKIQVLYTVRGSFQKLWKQYYQYGYFKVLVNRKHKTITSVRQLIPMLFVAGLAVGLVAAFFFAPFFYLYLAVILAYLGLNISTSIRLSANFAQVLYTLRAFLTLHLSYGCGYWQGILDFVILRRQKVDSKNEVPSL
jgi:glycosyltransferase involved in cell wall biosynthesis